MPLYAFFFITPLNQPITIDESSARRRSLQGTSFSGADRSTPLAAPAREEERLPVPGAVAVGLRREPEPLSPHCVVPRPSSLGTPSSVISSPAIQTFRRATSSFRGRPTLTGKSSAWSTGNTPPSCLYFSSPAYPIASRTTMILSRIL